MSELMKLREDHAKLARMFRQLGEVVAKPVAPPQLELFELRRDLVSTLLSHLKLEDWALYPRLIDSGDADASAAGEAFKDEMGGLAPAFLAYCDKWGATTIEADWAGYCADTSAILEALTNRLVRENRELLPLLERLDQAA
ncbi:MAG TPA: hemerythrin domain-containing protein [Sphingomicrobium sp.]